VQLVMTVDSGGTKRREGKPVGLQEEKMVEMMVFYGVFGFFFARVNHELL